MIILHMVILRGNSVMKTYIAILQRPGTEPNWFYFTKPFTWPVWTLLLGVLLLCPLILALIATGKDLTGSAQGDDQIMKKFTVSFWMHYGCIVQQGILLVLIEINMKNVYLISYGTY